MKGKLLTSISMALAVTLLSSTALAVTGTSKISTKGTKISFWYCYTDKIQQNNISLTKEFNDTVGKSMGITVNAEYQGDYATMAQKLKASYIAGTAPAVTVMDVSMLKPFEASKVIEPMDTYINRDKVDMKDFQPAFLTDSKYGGKTYSLPYLRSTPILYLNTTLLKQAGLDPKGPATMDELVKYAKKVKEKTGKYGMSFFADEWLFQGLMMGQGVNIYNDETNVTNINSAAAKKVINYFNEMGNNGSAHVLASSQANNLLADITSKNCAMWYYSTGGLTTFMALGQKNGFDVATAFMPKGIKYSCPTGGANLVMISKQTDAQKEASWQFIKWMTQKEQAIKASMNTGYLPTRLSAVEDPKMQALYKKAPQFRVAINQLSYAGGVTSSSTEANTEIVKALDSIFVNKLKAEDVLPQLQTKVNQLLKQ